MKYDIPLEYFEQRLLYNRHDGTLIWRDGQCKGEPVGCVVENKAGNQYRFMSIGYRGDSCNFMVHQVIWFMCVEHWADEIDHIDGDGLNNQLLNLRPVTRTINNMNHRKQKNNSSGLAGVSFLTVRGKWRAYGTEHGRQIQLAYTDNLFDAICSRKSWEHKNEFTERHGK